jgi:hypothetical protein
VITCRGPALARYVALNKIDTLIDPAQFRPLQVQQTIVASVRQRGADAGNPG